MDNYISFQEALNISSSEGKRHLLTGNGFSIACKKDIFVYDSLFEQADFSRLSPNVKKAFDLFDTKDFEIIMRALKDSSKLISLYSKEQKELIAQLEFDAAELRTVLVNAIASSHPERPDDISQDEYACCIKFLKNFSTTYTLNYDLLLYWTIMNSEGELRCDDGFRTPDEGKTNYVSWDIEKTDGQNIHYLHGALHLYDAGSKLQKYTWVNTGVKLIDQIRTALENDLYPLIVSEGKSIEKVDKIMHSNYLSRGMRSLSKIGGSLFIYGHSLASNDSHFLNLIPKSKIKRLFVSLFGDPNSPTNQSIISTAEKLVAPRVGRNRIELYFYDSISARVWR
jgi:hypothetical protein